MHPEGSEQGISTKKQKHLIGNERLDDPLKRKRDMPKALRTDPKSSAGLNPEK